MQQNQIPTQVPYQMQNQIPTQVPYQMTNQMQNQIPTQVPYQMTNQMPTQAPFQMMNQMPTQMPYQMPNQVPNQMPYQMPGQMQFTTQSPMPGQMVNQINGQIIYPAQAPMTNQMYQNQMVNQGGFMTNMYQQVAPGVPNNNNFTNTNFNNTPTPNTININSNQNNQVNSNNGEPQSLLPENKDMIGTMVYSDGIVNVIFEASTGSTAVIQIKESTTIKEAIEKYAEKIKLNQKYIGKEVIFVLNGKKLDPFSNDIIVAIITKKNPTDKVVQFKVNVFDQANVLGA